MHGPITHKFPFEGSNEERAQYTRLLNAALRERAAQRSWHFLDVHSLYADEHGMLPWESTDGTVHVGQPAPVQAVLLRLLQEAAQAR